MTGPTVEEWWRTGDKVDGERCPTCRRLSVVYNGNYFCTACDWIMGEQGRPARIIRAYLQQRWLEARNRGDTEEMARLDGYLEDLIKKKETARGKRRAEA